MIVKTVGWAVLGALVTDFCCWFFGSDSIVHAVGWEVLGALVTDFCCWFFGGDSIWFGFWFGMRKP